MNLEPIVNYLAANGIGRKGNTLFAYNLPNVDFGILVIAKSPVMINPYQKSRKSGQFQLVVRGRQAREVLRPAEQAVKLLDGEGIVMGDMRFLVLKPVHEPLLYPRSDGNMLEASVNFSFEYIDL